MHKICDWKLRHSLLAGTSLFLVLSSPLSAQTAQVQNDGPIEQVVVSASRISIAGYQEPTPVSVISAAQLQTDALTDTGDAIRELPALMGGGSSPNNNSTTDNIVAGTAGEDLVNLRNLGILRTLVLVDGQRIVASNITGGVDLSTIPSSLLQRVDIVTGGASAAWGSDAVAGVVNLVLNKTFEGFKANLEGGTSYLGDRDTYKAEATYGVSFAGDRAHIIISGQYQDSPDAVWPTSRSWFNGTQLVNNPAYTAANGQPQYIHANNVGYSEGTQGGVITSGPLANTQFVGQNGAPVPFNPGNVSGLYSNGGDGDTTTADTDELAAPFRNTTLFGYGSYNITPAIKFSVQLNYGDSFIENNATPDRQFNNITINSNNAFLPSSIAAAMAADGLKSFELGSINNNNLNMNNLSMGALANSLGVPVDENHRQLYRGVFSLDGAIGEDWSWNLYYQHGESRVHDNVLNDVVTANYNNAVNAVYVTAANVGSSGLPIGSIACASTLTNPTGGCQPLDVFGNGVASQQAINYVDSSSNYELMILNEDVVSGSAQGQLPWGLPAGPAAVAFGGEYRKEAGHVTTSPMAAAGDFSVGNFAPFQGSYNVEEGFAEFDVPILKDNYVQSLDFNSAGRITSYSTSGLVETWKLGLTSQVNDDFRLRGSWSYDIRAPDLSELYAAGAQTANRVIDPHSGQSVSIFDVSLGNPNLQPERSTTLTGGVVYTPHWLDGFTLSLDWYSINIKDAIYSTGAATELAQCNAGLSAFCSALVFGGAGGALSKIIVEPLNAASAKTSGLDFQADYGMDFLSGRLSLRAVGNYMDEQTQNALGVTTDYAGSLGANSVVEGVPKFKATASATYTEGPWEGTIQGRFIGSGTLDNAWTTGVQVDNNNVPAVAYLDLRGSYRWNDQVQFYAAVDNTLNTPPPDIPSTQTGSSYLFVADRSDIYDALGRMYRAGVRFSY